MAAAVGRSVGRSVGTPGKEGGRQRVWAAEGRAGGSRERLQRRRPILPLIMNEPLSCRGTSEEQHLPPRPPLPPFEPTRARGRVGRCASQERERESGALAASGAQSSTPVAPSLSLPPRRMEWKWGLGRRTEAARRTNVRAPTQHHGSATVASLRRRLRAIIVLFVKTSFDDPRRFRSTRPLPPPAAAREMPLMS